MAEYTTLNKVDIKEIVKQYEIPSVISHQILNGGVENTTHLITTEGGKYVLTICEQKTIKKAIELALLLEYLIKYDFSTSKVLRNIDDDLVTIWNNKPVILKTFIEGRIITNLPDDVLIIIGKELAQLHNIEAPEYLPKIISYGIENFSEVSAYKANTSFSKWLDKRTVEVELHLLPNLPKSIIHSDLFYSNIIISEDNRKATIMDFEEAGYYYRVFDIGMTIVGLCAKNEKIDLQKAGNFFEGYQQVNKLLDIEISKLKIFTMYAAMSISCWRYKQFNFIQPDSTLFTHYLEMKNIADHIMSLPEDCFSKLI
ncbi:MAG: homoserine kinase [Saprospiraceae bacterium]